MASHLDLEEQEQLEQLKAFWARFGNLIMAVVTVVLLALAGWNGWNWWQRDQAAKAAGLYEQLQGDIEAGELDKAASAFAVLKDRFPGTTVAAQGALLTAKLQQSKSQGDAARATLAWAAEHASEAPYRDLAQLRLAGLLMDAKQLDAAAKALDAVKSAEFAGLVADRRGDLASLKNQPDVAKAEYMKAFLALEANLDYRRLVEAKLAALGVAAPEVKFSIEGAAK